MAATFSARAGSTFRANVEYREPPLPPETDPQTGELIDVTGFTARLQLRSASSNRRVILAVSESTQPDAILSLDPEASPGGRWFIFLPASITRTLPPVSHIEVELVNDANPDDVSSLFSGAIRIAPEQVVRS
jgi:hypothetical protein